MLDFENKFYSNDVNLIVGVDEAGRGPLCGPVVAACCILPKGYKNEKINDSKQISEKNREILYEEILKDCIAYGIGIVDVEEIDKINIYQASKIAMYKAIENMNHDFDLVVSDAMPLEILGKITIPIIKGDAKCECIAAASIIAKVTRDRIMREYSEKYPEYGFDKHKGYGTKGHIEAIKKYGIIEGFYRKTYEPIKSMLKK